MHMLIASSKAQLILDQMKGKDESYIKKLVSAPPHNLDDMIYDVFERLYKEVGEDQDSMDTTARILTWVSFARRPLNFGELDVIARLYSGDTNFMLWEDLRGKFASIFRFRYPKGYDPDAILEQLGKEELNKGFVSLLNLIIQIPT